MIGENLLPSFRERLVREEKSPRTVEQYVRAAGRFVSFLAGREPRREHVLAYKEQLEQRFRPSSCNSALTAVNRFLSFLGKEQCRVRLCRMQQSSFRSERRELNRAGYGRLLEAASRRGDVRLCLLMQTLCGMGLRVSEHRFVTAESLRAGWVRVQNKGKLRAVPIPAPLRRELRRYCREQGISSGPVFITKHGNPLDRSNIWRMMKRLCASAGVAAQKVFPHNLRHLFALTFYQKEKDIVRLADLLGHSSIETARIYTQASAESCSRALGRLNLTLHRFPGAKNRTT